MSVPFHNRRVLGRYRFNLPIGEWAAGQLFKDVTAVAFRHHLQLPTDLTLLIRVIAMSEGLGIQLDPNFNLLDFAEPYLKHFWLGELGRAALQAGLYFCSFTGRATLVVNLTVKLGSQPFTQDQDRQDCPPA